MAVRQGKILVIDDNEDILFTLKMLLRPLAESVTTCTNPKEINRLVSTTKYNVVLPDMNFTADAVSGKEGFYWLERIREISPETVVILITAYSDTERPSAPSKREPPISSLNPGRTRRCWQPSHRHSNSACGAEKCRR